jgi:ankyrin repeat protein
MYIAAQNGHLETVKLLLEKAPATAEVQQKAGWTPMHIAAQNGHLETVKLLLEKAPATAQVQSNFGSTPMHIAAQNGHLETVKLLLEKAPATAEVQTTDGQTPRHLAAKNGYQKIVLCLEQHVKGNSGNNTKHKPDSTYAGALLIITASITLNYEAKVLFVLLHTECILTVNYRVS